MTRVFLALLALAVVLPKLPWLTAKKISLGVQIGAKKREAQTQKGCVATENNRDRIRLRWGYQGKRYYLYTELPYTQAALKVAEQLANKIELDMLCGHFDQSLVAYGKKVTKSSLLTVVGVFEALYRLQIQICPTQNTLELQGDSKCPCRHFGTKPSQGLTKGDVKYLKSLEYQRLRAQYPKRF